MAHCQYPIKWHYLEAKGAESKIFLNISFYNRTRDVSEALGYLSYHKKLTIVKHSNVGVLFLSECPRDGLLSGNHGHPGATSFSSCCST